MTGLRIRRLRARLVLALAIGALVAGCYETNQEIITIDRAVAIANLTGEYEDWEGYITTISAVPYSNEYRFVETSSEGQSSYGTMRVIPIQGDT